jgi:hypothetical protein
MNVDATIFSDELISVRSGTGPGAVIGWKSGLINPALIEHPWRVKMRNFFYGILQNMD